MLWSPRSKIGRPPAVSNVDCACKRRVGLCGDDPIRALGDTPPPMPATAPLIRVNRAPVLTMRATVVAERLGYPREAAIDPPLAGVATPG